MPGRRTISRAPIQVAVGPSRHRTQSGSGAARRPGEVSLKSGYATSSAITDVNAQIIVAAAAILPAVCLVCFFPSSRNIIGWSQLAFVLIAFVAPVITSNAPSVPHHLTAASICGFTGAVFAILLNRLSAPRIVKILLGIPRTARARLYAPVTQHRLGVTLVVASATVIATFAYLGFAPILAEDPLLAKFFRGPYGERFATVALPYRLAWSVLPTLAVLAIGSGLRRTLRPRWVIGGMVAVAVLLAALTREPALTALQVTLLALVSRRTKSAVLVFICALLTIIAGTIVPRLVLDQAGPELGLVDSVTQQVPDYHDLAQVSGAFERANDPFTYGRTSVGGLVPFQYEWNPAIWGLNLVNQSSDVSKTASGGYRLPGFLWGYLSFGYLGAFGFTFVQILTTRWFAIAYRSQMSQEDSLSGLIVTTGLYGTVGALLLEPYFVSLYLFPPIALSWYLVRPGGERSADTKRRTYDHSR